MGVTKGNVWSSLHPGAQDQIRDNFQVQLIPSSEAIPILASGEVIERRVEIPGGCHGFQIQSQIDQEFHYAFSSGNISAGNFLRGTSGVRVGVEPGPMRCSGELWFKSAVAAADTLDIVWWRRS